MKPPRRSRCTCGARIVWARGDDGRWYDVDAQARIDRYCPDGGEPVVLWWECGAADRVQRVSFLSDYERAHGPLIGGGWRLHFEVCAEADKVIPMGVSERGRRLLAILKSAPRTKGGRA